jgi:glucose dehydrogenase
VATGTTTAAAVVSGAKIAFPRTGPAHEWPMPGADYSNSRYSELAQITPTNAKNLRAAWTFSTGVLRGHEGQPLVVANTMYLVTPYPNVAYALDLTVAGSPLRWKFRPENDQAAQGIACCDVVNRGATYSDGRIYYNLLDGHTVAVDASTGRQVWRTRMGDLKRGETITMAPIVAKNKVLVGSSGGEMGVRGWIAALDATTGRELWRGYSVGPDAETKVGPRREPRHDDMARSDLEDRRRRRVGMALVRSGAQPRLLRHEQPRAVERLQAKGRQQVDRVYPRARRGHG